MALEIPDDYEPSLEEQARYAVWCARLGAADSEILPEFLRRVVVYLDECGEPTIAEGIMVLREQFFPAGAPTPFDRKH